MGLSATPIGVLYAATGLVTLAIVATAANVPNERIIGGKDVDIGKHPYLVSIRYKMQQSARFMHECGGSIYTAKVIITSAQCVKKIGVRAGVIVVAGAATRNGTDGMLFHVHSSHYHANYSEWTVDSDIGLLMLEEELPLDKYDVASIDIMEQRPPNGRKATVAGWGYREEYGPNAIALQEVEVPFVSQELCTTAYGDGEITERMICAGYRNGGKDACQGDTGGPLVYNQQLVGLVSWGRGCARPNYPSVYTFVGSLKQWIDDTIAAQL